MALIDQPKPNLTMTGKFMNEVISFIIFLVLDILDSILGYIYKFLDFVFEAEWKPCYCSSTKQANEIVCLNPSKLQLHEISETLYIRPSLVCEVSNSTSVKDLKKPRDGAVKVKDSPFKELKKLKVESTIMVQSREKMKRGGMVRSSSSSIFSVNSTFWKRESRKIEPHCVPRWFDCACDTCHSWSYSCNDTLFVKVDGKRDNVQEDVIFIHGYISSSKFWTETIFPNLSESAKSTYRFLAVDLLGFGRSPKPDDSDYTLGEHLKMIEKSVIQKHNVKSFHIVAHSMGCIIAIALAVKYRASIKSLTFVAPPYFPAPEGENAAQYMLRRVAPRRIFPILSFGASIVCWYEHLCRTVCVLVCKNHRIWEFIANLITRNRMRTYLMESFWCHTHKAAWHTLHNVICGTAAKIEGYLDVINNMKCNVTIFHGIYDEVIPVECSYNLQAKVPRAKVKLIENKDHLTIVVGRQKAFAMELEQIWTNSTYNPLRRANCRSNSR